MERLLKARWFHGAVIALLAVIVFIIYSGTLSSSFHFDDIPQIVENRQLRDLKNLPAIIAGQRGVTMATFALNYAVGGLNVRGWHAVNIVIHIINGALAYLFVFTTLSIVTKDELWSKKIAAYSALLFSVHPVQTQAVTYIVQRMESLSSLFYLLALFIFIKGSLSSAFAKRIILYTGVVLFYIIGFKAKEVAITLPAAVLLYEIYFLGTEGRRGRLPLYAALGAFLVYFALSTVIPLGGFGDLSRELSGQSLSPPPIPPAGALAPSAGFGVQGISPLEYLYTQTNVIIYYISLLFFPANQNIDYDFPISRGLFETPKIKGGTVLNIPIPPPFVSIMILAFIIGLGVYLFLRSRKDRARKRGLVISFFIFWFFIILSPTSSFIPILDVIFEHRVYLASLGFFVVFAICFDWFFERPGKRKESAYH
ncbi:MAG: hypothetical protein HY883_07020 [Deltaproteobacteria bacterium]|nr:hypothetical protein [Deltaproteobacteria bacterium]